MKPIIFMIFVLTIITPTWAQNSNILNKPPCAIGEVRGFEEKRVEDVITSDGLIHITTPLPKSPAQRMKWEKPPAYVTIRIPGVLITQEANDGNKLHFIVHGFIKNQGNAKLSRSTSYGDTTRIETKIPYEFWTVRPACQPELERRLRETIDSDMRENDRVEFVP